ncbi:glycosyltransferase family 39 protein [bacterium]|nr:glycosyltransferase family 39 protein [bacterium]
MEMPGARSTAHERVSRTALALGLAITGALLAARLAAPDSIDALDQAKQGLYVVDAYREGRWLVPMEQATQYPTKPPLMTWLSLVPAFLQGGVTEFGVRAPSFLGAAMLLFAVVRFARHLGATASTAAAVSLASSIPFAKCAGLARTDMLLAAATTLAAAEIFESWAAHESGSGSPGRRILAAAAFAGIGTVAKSPVALVCTLAAAAVFLAIEPRARRWPRAIGVPTWLLAVAIYLTIVAAWFGPALAVAGEPLYRTFKDELLGHVTGAGEYASQDKAQPFYYPIAHFTSKFLPWTFLYLAVPAVVKSTSTRDGAGGESDRARDLGPAAARFALAALVGGLVIFMLPRVKRQDHVLPCYPWAAVLVGAVFARFREGSLLAIEERIVANAFRLTGVAALAATVALPLALSGNRIVDALGARAWVSARGAEPILDSLPERPWLVLALALLAGLAGLLAWRGARPRRASLALAGTALTLSLAIVLFEHALAEAVVTGKGVAVPGFCAKARALAGSRPLVFYGVPGSVPFYFERSQPNAGSPEAVVASLAKGARGVVTNRIGAQEVRDAGADLVPACSSAFFVHGDGPPRTAVWRLVLLVPPGELLLALPATARAQEASPGARDTPAPPPIASPRRDEKEPRPAEKGEQEKEGFGQEPGAEPRLPRIRLEVSYVAAFLQSRARQGRTGASNTIFPHENVHVPRWNMGERGSVVVKLHRYLAVGFEFVRVSSEGSREPVNKDVRWGGIPTEVPEGSRASGSVEIEQGNVSLRLVAADGPEFRVEVGAGFAWSSYRLAIHPAPPLTLGAGGGLPFGSSRRIVGYFAPTLGTFFSWNVAGSRVAIFLDQYSGYFATRIGSVTSFARAGVRFQVARGFEIVLGAFLIAGNIFDIHDRWENRAHGHRWRVADWTGGGPDIGLSFTY